MCSSDLEVAGTVNVRLGIRNEAGEIIAPGSATVRFSKA